MCCPSLLSMQHLSLPSPLHFPYALPWWLTWRIIHLQCRRLGCRDSVEKGMAPYSSTLTWKIPRTEEPGELQTMWLQRVRHDWETDASWALGRDSPSHVLLPDNGKAVEHLCSPAHSRRESFASRGFRWTVDHSPLFLADQPHLEFYSSLYLYLFHHHPDKDARLPIQHVVSDLESFDSSLCSLEALTCFVR